MRYICAHLCYFGGGVGDSFAQEASWRGIPVRPENRCSPYDRDDYPYPQSVELEIIALMGGRICSPYTETCFASRYETDIEHIIALSEAHDSGLCAAGAATRRAFATDTRNLTLASPQLNRFEKRAKDAAEWLPVHNRCWFAERIVEVRRAYQLTIDRREADALAAVLSDCGASIASPPGGSGSNHAVTYPGRVNVRSCASTACDIVAKFPAGRLLVVQEMVNGAPVNGDARWLKVQHGGEIVYVHASLAAPLAEITATVRPAATARPTTTARINIRGSTTAYYSLGGVNVRSCASTACSVVGRLARADEVAVLQAVTGQTVNGNRSWKAIRYRNALAFVHASLLARTKPAPISVSPPADPPQSPCGDPATTVCSVLKRCYGYGRFTPGHPGYHPNRDSDNDGIACER